ncbi:DUF899 domain-containing protein [Kutzneria sp. NPDC051319]|uniref:DUF899 domain-containing protein n=1 Tax=Kutzneria sp. NPDC051319 TaxID=3155047 RepID=UPI00342F6F1C
MKVVEPEQWQAALKELQVREQELAAVQESVRTARQQLPMVRVDKKYVFRGADGEVSLPDLFEGRRQLIVYHFMFDPSWQQGCKWCSYLVDNIGHLSHLHVRDTTLALVSRAPIEKILPFRERMGWTVPWYSSHDSDFNDDFSATVDKTEQGGASVFLREGDDIYHTYSGFGEAMDMVHTIDNYLDLTPLGRGSSMSWLRHHDGY